LGLGLGFKEAIATGRDAVLFRVFGLGFGYRLRV